MNILMTGCSRSVGATIREKLIAQGHDVFGMGIGGPDYEVDFLSDECPYEVGRKAFATYANYHGGSIDCLINNAGITRIDFLENHSIREFEDVLQVNLTWPFGLCKAFLESREHTNSKIINVSSMGATLALRASPGYCASKAGLEMLTKGLAKEFAGRKKITVIGIAPGGIQNTAMIDFSIEELQRTRGMTEKEAIAYNAQSPMGRNMTHEELWEVFDFAVNDAPEYMSGTILKCTGGMGI